MKELPDIVTASAYWYWDWYKNGGTFIGIPLKRYYPAWYETEEDIDAWKALDPENRKIHGYYRCLIIHGILKNICLEKLIMRNL